MTYNPIAAVTVAYVTARMHEQGIDLGSLLGSVPDITRVLDGGVQTRKVSIDTAFKPSESPSIGNYSLRPMRARREAD